MAAKKSNGKSGNGHDWDTKPYNLELARIFPEDIVDRVRKNDLEDKDDYDRLDRLSDRLRDARAKIHRRVRGHHDDSSSI